MDKELFMSILSSLPGHLFWLDRNNFFMGCNEQQAKDLELRFKEDIVGKTPYDFFAKEQADKIVAINNVVMKTGEVHKFEETFVDKYGKEKVFLTQIAPLLARDEIVGGVGISADITDHKQLEVNLGNAKWQLENIIALMPGNVYWLDRQGVYLGCNDNQYKMSGYKARQEFIGKTYEDMFTSEMAVVLRKTNMEIMESDTPKTLEEVAIFGDKSRRTYLTRKVPLHDDEGGVVGLLGVSIDITERKKAEQALLGMEVERKRLENMVTFGASIAHELRTPLRAIESGVNGVKRYLPDLLEGYKKAIRAKLDVPFVPQKRYAILEDVLNSVATETRAAFTIIDMLLVKAKQDKLIISDLRPCSINDCIDLAIDRYPFKTGDRNLIKWNESTNKDFVFFGEELLMIHVLFNLIKNALYFIKAAGKGRIHIWLERGKEYNKLYFKDTGLGIPFNEVSKIFQRFYTSTRHGSGMGLAFCKAVMLGIGGDIVVNSKKGKFTEFMLSFPADPKR